MTPKDKQANTQWNTKQNRLKQYDYTSVEVVLISSIPDRHSYGNRNKWVHFKLKEEIRRSVVKEGKMTETSNSSSSGNTSKVTDSNSTIGRK